MLVCGPPSGSAMVNEGSDTPVGEGIQVFNDVRRSPVQQSYKIFSGGGDSGTAGDLD